MSGFYGVPKDLSVLQKQRVEYSPELPPSLRAEKIGVEYSDTTTSTDSLSHSLLTQYLPHTYGQPLVHFVENAAADSGDCTTKEHPVVKVGFVFCGRQTPGGHNVVWGLYDALKKNNAKNSLIGFIGGSEGLFAQKTLEITEDVLATYKNQGGYDLLGRTKDQIKTTHQLNEALVSCQALELDGLVIAGGANSNNDAAQLAELFAASKCKTKVVGVPITLHGDLKNQFVEADVGFDTICKVNSQLVSNICTDALSAEKYYYFIRAIGRKASHVSLECALQCHPNMVILGEEVASSKQTLFDITNQIADVVQARAQKDKNHGVIIMPEGLVESIPEMSALLNEIHSQLKRGVPADDVASQLSPWASALFEFMPPFIKKQLLLAPESDGSAQLSQIELEKLLAQMVETEIEKRKKEGNYKGKKFSAICHFFGYQARGSLPSKFDCDYAYALGHVTNHIISAGLNGYMATISNLKNSISKWRCGAAPITAMMSVNQFAQDPSTKTVGKLAIFPATVDLKGKTYEMYKKNYTSYVMDDIYRNPGPIQYEGPGSEEKTFTLCTGEEDYMGKIKDLQDHLHKVQNIVKPGCSQDVLNVALSSMASVTKILTIISSPSHSDHSYL